MDQDHRLPGHIFGAKIWNVDGPNHPKISSVSELFIIEQALESHMLPTASKYESSGEGSHLTRYLMGFPCT